MPMKISTEKNQFLGLFVLKISKFYKKLLFMDKDYFADLPIFINNRLLKIQ